MICTLASRGGENDHTLLGKKGVIRLGSWWHDSCIYPIGLECPEDAMLMQRLFFVLMVVAMAGCLESNPQPSPLGGGDAGGSGGQEPVSEESPEVDENKIYSSAPDELEAVVIAADEGAAMGASGAYANAEEADPEADADNGEDDGDKGEGGGVDDDGSFVIVLSGVNPPKVTLTIEYPELPDVVLEIDVPSTTAADDDEAVWLATSSEKDSDDPGANAELPDDYDGFGEMGAGAVQGVTVHDAGDGEVEVVGSFFSVTPFSVVILVNLSSQEKSIVNANNQGEFIAVIAANPGDVLSLFASNPSDHSKATAPVYLTVE